MAEAVIMPKQGQSVEACIITQWFKQKGDKISKGDVLFSYETDKASFEEEAAFEGVLLDTFFEEGDEVPVLVNVAVIGNEGESVDEFKPDGGSQEKKEESSSADSELVTGAKEVVTELAVEYVAAPSNGKVKISPRAKKLAEEKGVPFSNLKGSGPEGRIIEQDIIAFIKTNPGVSPLARRLMKEKKLSYDSGTGLGGLVTSGDLTTASRVDYEEKPLTNMRKIIAKAMHNSLQNSAQLTHHLSADARKMLSLRSEVKKKIADGYSYNITLNDMVCYAAIQALSQFPEANIHLMGDSIRYFKNVHLGLAVDTERGLMVPTVKNANHLSLIELSVKLKEVAEACKKGSIDPDLLSSEAATFTVSNLGNYGVEMFTPIVNIPQACILGVNTIVQRPAPLENGAFGFVPYIGLSLSYDHRALDGGPATKLLATIKNEIENLQIQL